MSRYSHDPILGDELLSGNTYYNMIASVETSPTTSAHSKGDHFIYNGVLYEVTATNGINANTTLVVYPATGYNIKVADKIETQIDTTNSNVSSLTQALTTLEKDKVDKPALTTKSIIGTVNNLGSTINAQTLFYLNGNLVQAKVDIANGATLTEGTNYDSTNVYSGALNLLTNQIAERAYYQSNTIANGYRVLLSRENVGSIQFDVLTDGASAGRLYVIIKDSNGNVVYNRHFTGTA